MVKIFFKYFTSKFQSESLIMLHLFLNLNFYCFTTYIQTQRSKVPKSYYTFIMLSLIWLSLLSLFTSCIQLSLQGASLPRYQDLNFNTPYSSHTSFYISSVNSFFTPLKCSLKKNKLYMFFNAYIYIHTLVQLYVYCMAKAPVFQDSTTPTVQWWCGDHLGTRMIHPNT